MNQRTVGLVAVCFGVAVMVRLRVAAPVGYWLPVLAWGVGGWLTFGALLAGCSISVITALRAGDRGAVAVNGAFAVANGLGIARAIGLLG